MPKVNLTDFNAVVTRTNIPSQGTQAAQAAGQFGAQIQVVAGSLRALQKEKERRESTVKAAEILADSQMRMKEIEAEEIKQPVEEREAFRIKELRDLQANLQREIATLDDDSRLLVEKALPDRILQFQTAGLKRDIKQGQDERIARFDATLKVETDALLTTPPELFEGRLAGVKELIAKQGDLTEQAKGKRQREVERDVRIGRLRIAVKADPSDRDGSIEEAIRSSSLNKLDQRDLLDLQLQQQSAALNRKARLRGEQEAERKALVKELTSQIMVATITENNIEKAERLFTSPDAARNMTTQERKGLRGYLDSVVRRNFGATVTNPEDRSSYLTQISKAETEDELLTLMTNANNDDDLSPGTKNEVSGLVFNQLRQGVAEKKTARRRLIDRTIAFGASLFQGKNNEMFANAPAIQKLVELELQEFFEDPKNKDATSSDAIKEVIEPRIMSTIAAEQVSSLVTSLGIDSHLKALQLKNKGVLNKEQYARVLSFMRILNSLDRRLGEPKIRFDPPPRGR